MNYLDLRIAFLCFRLRGYVNVGILQGVGAIFIGAYRAALAEPYKEYNGQSEQQNPQNEKHKGQDIGYRVVELLRMVGNGVEKEHRDQTDKCKNIIND